MSKKKFPAVVSIVFGAAAVVVGGAILLRLFYTIFNAVTGKELPWWAYIVAAGIYCLIVYLCYLLIQIHSQKFDRTLIKQGFHTDKRYEANGQTLCIDFDGKRIANTYLSTKMFVPFDDVVNYRVECYRKGDVAVLPEDKRYVNLVITVNREDPTPDHPYLYLAMFEVQVDAADVPEIPDVTEEMVSKYPDLEAVYRLKQDVERILEINKSELSDNN